MSIKPYGCGDCNKRFRTKEGKDQHKTDKGHSLPGFGSIPWRPPGSCPACYQWFDTPEELLDHQRSMRHCVGSCASEVHSLKRKIVSLTDRNSLLDSRHRSIKATSFLPSWQAKLTLAAIDEHGYTNELGYINPPSPSFASLEARFHRKDSLSLLDLRLWKFMILRSPQFATLQEVRDHSAHDGSFSPEAFMLACKPDKHYVDLVREFLGW